ncbi:methyltransferase domain-containing protein [Bradyrhizobium lablabi]|uniref:SAM-dependent methyltransferase n=1 Tax=Bradyrhizobium lablabi TaxID=722472 RepID=UPI001BAB1069|nr:methyltransferase domain-containing protein [Bradyrhizobium lablabi]MBR0692734.1 methyltransferase domain-containing protein [Bradyrhizobium lablabi]
MTALRTTPPPDWLRHTVRGVLEQSPGYRGLQPDAQRALAQAMVKVSTLAAALIAEEAEADAAIARPALPRDRAAPRRAPLARAQDAPEFGTAANRIAGITGNVLNAVSFPRFVTDLISGVFKSMLDSNAQQMQLYVKLLNDVSASAEGFEHSQFSIVGVRGWVAEHFPDQIEYDLPEVEPGDDPPDPEELASITLRLKPNASMPEPDALRAVLGLGPEESVEAGNPEQLVPLARRAIARQRQQMLATMVMLGMQRIVIDSGRINASMRFHIDTRSAASEDRGSQFGMQNRVKAAGSFGYGPWGASAEVENTISYVSTQRSQNTEEINTDLELNSSVELVFKTDYLPLERLAGGPQIERIKVNTLSPEAEMKAATDARTARDKANREAEAKRAEATTKAFAPALSPPQAGGRGTVEDADRARADAAKKEKEKEKERTQQPREKEKPKEQEKPKDKAAKAQALAAQDAAREPDVVFVPTQPEAIDTMLTLAAPRRGETLIDLGCGDGRIVVAAALRSGCRAIGYDIDPQRVAEARARIAAAGVGDVARVEQRDLFAVDLSQADVVTLYLLPQLNVKLIPQLLRLRPGARVVSHDFAIAGVSPDRVVQDYLPRTGMLKTYFLFTAPLRLHGAPVHQWRESAHMPWEEAAA